MCMGYLSYSKVVSLGNGLTQTILFELFDFFLASVGLGHFLVCDVICVMTLMSKNFHSAPYYVQISLNATPRYSFLFFRSFNFSIYMIFLVFVGLSQFFEVICISCKKLIVLCLLGI